MADDDLHPASHSPDMESGGEKDFASQSGAPATLLERRRAQKKLFELWLVSEAAQETLVPKLKNPEIENEDDEVLSIHALMAKQGAKIVKNPRQYQLELFERALKENTIAVLDTGSGKTLIAVLLLKSIIDQELERREAGQPPQISFFLVASVTLVFQQFSVLETNLDHKVARVCGADGADNWDKSRWLKLFSENKVIVATADVLDQCLAHSYITMRQINLLVFDEAHHAKKNHAYARIVKNHYLTAESTVRPRIFGMTASPIDAKTDVVEAAGELESLLHSKIATTTDMSLTDAIKKPTELVLRYAALPHDQFQTKLLTSVTARFGKIAMFEKIFQDSKDIARHLGRWCADLYLTDALSERKVQKYERQAEQIYHCRTRLQDDWKLSQLDERVVQIREAVKFVDAEQSKYIKIESEDLSSKVKELQTYLAYQFERPTSHRCIVFVQKRHTARLLSVLFERIGSQNMRCGCLIGANNAEIEENNFTFRQQVMVLTKFRKGEINCLFATSVAEEGLDVPDCNLVVRFDLYSTMIQYVQSRGRARQQNSKFIHMIEIGNSIHAQLLQEVRFQETAMRRFCQALPADRKLVGDDDNLEALRTNEKMRVYTEPSTGAKLTYDNALVYLAHFVSAIPTGTEETMHPTYVVSSQGLKFIAEVLLPANAPIQSAIGQVCARKSLAKRSAAFEACLELRKKQYLNEHLMPTYQKKLPAMRNALLALNMKTTNQYVMRTKPSVWHHTRGGSFPTELCITIIDFPDGLERPHQPLALITRSGMPAFPPIQIFLNDGRATRVVFTKGSETLQVDTGMVEKLSCFTFRVFQDVFSKVYEQKAADLSYWIAPIKNLSSTEIDWPLLDEVFANEEYKWTPNSPCASLVKKFLVDRWDGGRKFYSKAIDPTLRPLDPVPDDVAKAKWEDNILDYSISLWKSARAKATWNLDQPVIEAEKILLRRNLLDAPNCKESKLRTRAFICPEPFRISVLPPEVATSCIAWPAIIHRLESQLIALEACVLVGIDCVPRLALAAVTKDSDNSGEHGNHERVNFQRGMGENYERLEFIGDTFLKAATTISIFIQNPNDNEFELHVKRMLMLCNQNLFNVAKDLKLYEYIRSIAFSRRLWYPEGLKLLEGKGVKKQEETSVIKHTLGDKTIADVCEALIGAAFLSHDEPGAWHPSHWESAIRAVTKLVNSPDHTMKTWNDYRAAYDKPAYQTGEVSASQRDLAEKVEREHHYHFIYPRLLRSAFIHPSQPLMQEKVPSYQRLEFLGDALLDMASITYLFHRFPDRDPQWLTEHKMAMVCNKFLGAVCVNIGFHRHLRFASSIMEHQIREYATELLEAKRLAGDSRDYWTTLSDPPKCLPDIVESFVGAMFVDSEFDYNEVLRFFDKHMKWYFEDMSIYDTFANNHPCTHLHHLLQTTYGCQDYRLMAKELPSIDSTEKKIIVAVVMIHDEIVSHSQGTSGKYTRLRVAQKALEVIDGLVPFDFRSRFRCDCQRKAKESADNVQGAAETLLADCTI